MTANAAKSDTRNIISLAIAESLSDIMCDSRMLALEAAICENHRKGDNDGYR